MESFERELFKRRKLKTSKNELINESIAFVLLAYEFEIEILSNESIKQYVCCSSDMSSRMYVTLYAFELVSALCQKMIIF